MLLCLLLIEKCTPCSGGSWFPLSCYLSGPLPYVRCYWMLSASLNKTFPSSICSKVNGMNYCCLLCFCYLTPYSRFDLWAGVSLNIHLFFFVIVVDDDVNVVLIVCLFVLFCFLFVVIYFWCFFLFFFSSFFLYFVIFVVSFLWLNILLIYLLLRTSKQ